MNKNNKNIRKLLGSLWKHISKKRKYQLGLLIILMFISSLVEVVSIGAVIPFLAVLAEPEVFFHSQAGNQIANLFGVKDSSDLLIPLTLLLAFAALAAGRMRITLLWGQTRLGFAIGADISYQIYRLTLYQPYSVHLLRNSSEVIAGISNKANQAVSGAIIPAMTIVSSVVILLIVFAALIVVDPLISLSALVAFSSIYIIVFMLSKKALYQNSQLISQKTNLVIKALQEGLGGIRDVLIDGAQSIYCKSFRSADIPMRRAIANNKIIGQSPRHIIESLGIIIIAFLSYSLSSRDGGLVSVLPTLGAFAIGAQRMLPMLQQTYAAWSTMRGSYVVIEDVISLLEQPLSHHVNNMIEQKIEFHQSITLNNASFSYSDNSSAVLKDLSINIKKGTTVGFVGKTGSGKSTLLDVLMALLHPTKGELMIDGEKISEENSRAWQKHISHIPQSIYLSDATILENIAFGIPHDEIDNDRVRWAAKQACISDNIESWQEQYSTIVGERGVRLSGGQRQRIGIARALYKNADVIILDEATSALDNKTEMSVMNSIENIGGTITVLIVAHRVTTLKGCDIIYDLENGKIKNTGSYDDLFSVEL